MKRALAIAAVALLLLAAAFGAGYWAAPEPTVTFHAVDRAVDRLVDKPFEITWQGPSQVVTRTVTKFAPGPPGQCPTSPAEVDQTTTATQGEAVTARGAEAVRERAQERQVSTAAPAPPRASWAVSGGLAVLPEQQPVFGVGHRLLGPFWAQLDVAPAPLLRGDAPYLALQLRAEF